MIETLQKKINRISLCRLFCFLAFAILLFSGLLDQSMVILILSLLFLVFFLNLVKKQESLELQLKREQISIDIDTKIKERQNEAWKKQQNERDDTAFYIRDLDVVGEDSLFHYLSFGICKEALLSRLKTPLRTKEEILRMQQVFQELSHHDFTKDLLITITLHPMQSVKKVDIRKMPGFLKACLVLYPIGLFTLLLLKSPFLLVYVLLGLGVSSALSLQWQSAFQYYDLQTRQLNSLEKQAEVIGKYTFESDFLQEKQRMLKKYQRLQKKAGTLNQWIQCRHNPFLLSLLNGLCLFESWLYYYLEKHPMDTSEVEQMRAALEDLGALCQMAQWYHIKPRTTYPKISDYLKAEDLKHPLLVSSTAIGATFDFNHDPVIITGSNMSGKTTFMRSLGLNLVLTYCGLSVDAIYFEAPILNIYTSMRVPDRMQEGVSTFYGELLRIKTMVEKRGEPCLFLIDEIFKGTNLKDRIIGAKAVIEKLYSDHSYVIISTHDEQLCTHEHVPLRLVHFQESYENQKIQFDYLLKDGMCETSNAQFLMKMTGILE